MGRRHPKSIPYRLALFASSVTLVSFVTTNIRWSLQLECCLSPVMPHLTFEWSDSFIGVPKQQLLFQTPVYLARVDNKNKDMTTSTPKSTSTSTSTSMLLQSTDSIYKHTLTYNDTLWDFSPIVLEDYKLVFFVLPPATVWKRLFRRMMGYRDWNSEIVDPHDSSTNGLKYLRDFNLSEANTIMTSPMYTRAIFVRDPLEKFYTLFHDTILPQQGEYVRQQCCPKKRDCFANVDVKVNVNVNVTPELFVNFLDQTHCQSPTWASMAERMESKYWKYINFVGHWEHVDRDSQDLLERLGVWNLFGVSGWGNDGQLSLSSQLLHVYQPRRRSQRIKPFYQDPSRQILVNHLYYQDYDTPVFGFSRYQLVQPKDFIYYKDLNQWDASPIVVEKYKLVFFTIPKNACTTWKMLFRRINGVPQYQDQDHRRGLPHDPARNGLRYLWHYSLEEANRIITSPEYTKAIFVREPKQRFLSAYLDKAVALPDFLRRKCCRNTTATNRRELACSGQVHTPVQFLDLIQECKDAHWVQQHYRMEDKYWPYINFIGRHESIETDAKRLLEKIGAWEEFGKSGWGKNSQEPIFRKGTNQWQTHTTDSTEKYDMFFTPELERKVEEFYATDYENSKLGFQKRHGISSPQG